MQFDSGPVFLGEAPTKNAGRPTCRNCQRTILLSDDERVAARVTGHLKGEEGGNTHHPWTQHLVPKTEVVAGKAAPLGSQNAMIRILGWVLGMANGNVGPCSRLLKMK